MTAPPASMPASLLFCAASSRLEETGGGCNRLALLPYLYGALRNALSVSCLASIYLRLTAIEISLSGEGSDSVV